MRCFVWSGTARRTGAGLIMLLALLAAPWAAWAQLDICGCGASASLGALNTADPKTYPAGTTSSNANMTIPLPDDGVLVFDSVAFNMRNGSNGTPNDGYWGYLNIYFKRNAANTPVIILVKGDFSIGGQVTLSVGGDTGQNGSAGTYAVGGLGGPGGFKGGDGAYQLVNFANNGGAGLGPGGGAGGQISPNTNGGNGVFIGVPELLPLVGGSGGGGGASYNNTSGASAGAGGGGGGAILIVANGTITINGSLNADGGDRGYTADGSKASYGGAGSGGAIRLVANTINGGGSIYARGGVQYTGYRANAGAVRLEAFSNTFNANNTDPIAMRSPAPGPLANPLNPTVAITAVGGQAVPVSPKGVMGVIDLILPNPGPTSITIKTTLVPVGTLVNLTVKPRVGGAPVVQNVLLGAADADNQGNCLKTVVMDLAAGAYTLECQATMKTP